MIDRYRVEGLLGRGGMASVYAVRHLQLGSLHALKIVDTTNEQLCRRLLQEGRVQARLSHANVVAVTDAVRVDGRPGLVLEYVAGPTLGEVLRVHRLTPAQVDHLALGILRGVEVAHGLGFAHRDLKPGNILIARSPEGPVPKVADFGLAKVLEGTGLDTTRPNMAMGTPSYMAPEQISDARSADTVSDVFSLGAILYEMVTGEKAFPGATVFEIFRRIGAGEYPRLGQVAPGLPARMVRTIEAALEVDRSARAASVRQLRELWTADGWTPSFGDPFGTALDALFAERAPNLEPFTPEPEAITPAPARRVDPVEDRASATVIPDDEPLARSGSGSDAPPAPRPPVAEDATTLPPPVDLTPAARASSGRTVLAVGAGVATLVLLALAWSLRPPTPDPAPAPPPPTPVAAAPAPAPAPAPDPDPAPPPEPAAVVPAPAPPPPPARPKPAPAPVPSVAVRPPADPPPDAVRPPDPAPPPPPEPAPPTTGHVEVVGDVARVFFRPAGTTQSLYTRDLPPGKYIVYAVFDEKPTPMLEADVVAGSTSTLHCSAAVRMCKW